MRKWKRKWTRKRMRGASDCHVCWMSELDTRFLRDEIVTSTATLIHLRKSKLTILIHGQTDAKICDDVLLRWPCRCDIRLKRILT
jgi:hypothetical protein